jgi:hypothetical protein
MTTLTDEMLQAITLEIQSLPKGLLEAYRNPPGRKPSGTLLMLKGAIAHIDDETAEALIRDVVDAAVFQMIYLLGAGFKSDLKVEISRGDEREHLSCTLHEDYRGYIDPGGAPHHQS